MKKILALCLSIILVVSSLAMTVSAAEMITVTVPAQTLIDQDFAGLLATPSDWTVGGTYSQASSDGVTSAWTNGITGTNYKGFTVYKNEAYDAGLADYTVEFDVRLYSDGATSWLHFGADTSADATSASAGTGYTLKMIKNNSPMTFAFYKNGVELTPVDAEGNAITPSVAKDNYYQKTRTYKFNVTKTGVTVTGIASEPVVYADASPITNGYVGAKIVANAGGTAGYLGFKRVSVKSDEYSYEMEKPAEVVTGAKVTYEKPGSSYLDVDLRGAAALPAGVTAGGTYSFGASGLTWSGNPNVSTSFGTVEVPSDVTNFTVEARYTAKYNGAPVFSFLGYKLTKKGDYNGTKTYTLAKGTETLGTGTLGAAFYAGSVPVKVTFAGNNITVNVDGTDVITATDANVSKSGNVSIAAGYTGSWTVGNVYIASPASDVTKTNFLMDKTFSNNDTIASLNADGYSLSGVTTVSNSGVGRVADNSFSVFYTGSKFEGAYTAEITGSKSMNWGTAYFNRTDASNHYSFATQSNSSTTGNIKFGKTVDGTYTSFLTDADGNPVESMAVKYGTNATSTYKASFEPLDNGDLKITISFENYAGNVYTYTYTDKKTDEYTPMTSGYMGYANGYSAGYVKSMKAYPTPAEGENAVKYSAGFKVGANDATEIAKGNTMFTFPIAMIGQTPDFIAVLYEDYKMADIKIIDVKDINEGIVSLFDTTSSTSDNISISVFVWNSLEGMVPVLETYTLD